MFSLVDVYAGEAPALSRKCGYFRVGEVRADGNAVVSIQIFPQPAKASAVGRRDFDYFRETIDQSVYRLGRLVLRNFN